MPATYYPSESLELNIARGLVKGTSHVHKFGAVPSLSISNTATIWDKGDTLYPWSAYSSANVAVVAAASGENGKEITISGLDADYNVASETVTITGGAATTNTEFIRVNRAFIVSGADNTANVNISVNGTQVARILEDFSQTLMSVYTVPANHTGYLMQGIASIEYGGDASINMHVRYFGQDAFRIGHSGEVAGTGMPYNYNFAVPIAIPEKSDIDIRATVRSNNSRVTAAFDIILIENGLGA